ncbi:MAG TPA: hypothetical protein VF483_13100 [Gemmatimonadaceae bacterium]
MRSLVAEEHAMALRLPRWIAVAVAGTMVIAATFLTPSAPKPRRHSDVVRAGLAEREMQTSQAAMEAASLLRSMQLKESLSAAMSRLPAVDSSRFVLSPSLPKFSAAMINVLGARAASARAKPPVKPIDIAFVWDTMSRIRGRPLNRWAFSVTHALPAVPGGRCLAVGRVQRDASWFGDQRYWAGYLTSPQSADRLLGPCAYYETFGAPGPSIDRWLANGAWRFAGSPVVRPPDDWSYVGWWAPLWGRTSGWPLRMFTSVAGYRCASGDAATCRQIVLDPNADPDVRVKVHVGRDRIVTNEFYSGSLDMAMGPLESMLLPEMAKAMGTDQFRRFWTSDKPVDEAFRAVTGQDIGEWSAAWAQRAYSRPGRGPGMDAASMAWTLVLILGGLAGAIAASRRRQVA